MKKRPRRIGIFIVVKKSVHTRLTDTRSLAGPLAAPGNVAMIDVDARPAEGDQVCQCRGLHTGKGADQRHCADLKNVRVRRSS